MSHGVGLTHVVNASSVATHSCSTITTKPVLSASSKSHFIAGKHGFEVARNGSLSSTILC